MHDWTLLDVVFDWERARVELRAEWKGAIHVLMAEGVVELHVPKRHEWGPSIYINSVSGPVEVEGGYSKLEIEIQSGDVIQIVGKGFVIPSVPKAGLEPFQLPIGKSTV